MSNFWLPSVMQGSMPPTVGQYLQGFPCSVSCSSPHLLQQDITLLKILCVCWSGRHNLTILYVWMLNCILGHPVTTLDHPSCDFSFSQLFVCLFVYAYSPHVILTMVFFQILLSSGSQPWLHIKIIWGALKKHLSRLHPTYISWDPQVVLKCSYALRTSVGCRAPPKTRQS